MRMFLRWTVLFLACASAGTGASADDAAALFDLTHLLRGFAAIPSSKAGFIEVRRLAALDTRVTARGVLSYDAPDRLERDTREPVHERYVAEGDKLTMEHEFEGRRRQREFRLSDFAPLRPFILAVRVTLAGDLAAMQRLFVPTLTGTEADWKLILKPKREELGSAVREIRLRGHANQVTTIEIDEDSGDTSVITLSPFESASPVPGS
jgi:Outer membrane lipoprotein carrier protein LolA-like